MLTDQNIESELSYAYLHAVASGAGVICEYSGRNTDATGVDATLRFKGKLAKESLLTQLSVDVQLKATKRIPKTVGNAFQFRLKRKNYDDLRSVTTGSPQLLIVLFLPSSRTDWLKHSQDELTCRRCAYWVSLRGAEPIGKGSTNILIPKQNHLSSESLLKLLVHFSKGEVINYAST